jgi:hypothetical protein
VTLTGGNASYTFYDENTAGRMVSEADLPDIPDTCAAGSSAASRWPSNPAPRPTPPRRRMSQAGGS